MSKLSTLVCHRASRLCVAVTLGVVVGLGARAVGSAVHSSFWRTFTEGYGEENSFLFFFFC